MAKRPAYGDPCIPWLYQLSKAALIDCVVDLLRGAQDSAEDPVEEAAAIERLTPVLHLRKDPIPPGDTVRRQIRSTAAAIWKRYARPAAPGEVPHRTLMGYEEEFLRHAHSLGVLPAAAVETVSGWIANNSFPCARLAAPPAPNERRA